MLARLPVLVALAAAGAAPCSFAATVLCVDDSAGLQAALDASATEPDLEIRMKTGNYPVGDFLFHVTMHAAGKLEMSGGWSGPGDTCTTRMRNSALTTLDGNDALQVMAISTDDDSTTPSITLHNFSLIDGGVESGLAGCLSVYLDHGTATVLLDRLRLTGCSNANGSAGALRMLSHTGSSLTLRNSVVAGNDAGHAAGVYVETLHPDASVVMAHNTVVGNTTTHGLFGSAGGIDVTSSANAAGSVLLLNNIIAFNTAGGMPSDLYSGMNPIQYSGINNALTSEPHGLQTNVGTIMGDPRFVSDGDLRLAEGSPLIDAGAPITYEEAGDRDFLFHLRTLGQAPDIGAYESDYAVFGDSFE